MSKKNHPNKPAPTPPTPPEAVRMGNVFVTFMREASGIANELEARRAVQADLSEFLSSRGLAEEFEAWRKAKYAAPNAT